MKYITSISLIIGCIYSTAALGSQWLYSVKPGDTFWDLCLKYTNKNTCWQELPKINHVSQTKKLPPGFVIKIPAEWLKNQPSVATATYVKGEAHVIYKQKKQPLLKNQTLLIGSLIETQNGYVNLTFSDNSIVNVLPNSTLSLDAFSNVLKNTHSDSQIHLQKGTIKAKVKKRIPASRFKISTPAAVAAVRGTEYRVTSYTDKTNTEVLRAEVTEGAIAVSNSLAEQNVMQGFGIVANKNKQIASPTKLLKPITFKEKTDTLFVPSTIEWLAAENSLSYAVEIQHNNDNNETIQSYSTTAPAININTIENGCYQLVIRAIDSNQLVGLPAFKKICAAKKITTPTLSTQNYSAEINHIKARWKPTDTALNYQIQIAEDIDFKTLILNGTIFETHIEIKTDIPVFIRVKALGFSKERSMFSKPVKLSPKKPKTFTWH